VPPPGAALTALSAAQSAEVKEPAAAVHCDRSNCRPLALQWGYRTRPGLVGFFKHLHYGDLNLIPLRITLRVMPSPILLDLLPNYMERCIGQTDLLFGSSHLRCRRRKPGIAFTTRRGAGAGSRIPPTNTWPCCAGGAGPAVCSVTHGSDGDRVLFYSGMAQRWNEGAQ